MTKSERMVRYRQKLKEKGKMTVTLGISENVIKAIDLYRSETGQTRGDALESILDSFLEAWAEDYELIDCHIKEMEHREIKK